MRFKGWILAVAAVIATPATAQYVSDAEALIDAVTQREGSTIIQLVRDRGPSLINTRNADGETALITAINARDDSFTLWLLQNGADPNYATGDGERPLVAAARIGYGNAVDWLLSLGAPVDATNRTGETALIVAVQQRRRDIVERLLAAGADPDISDNAAGYSARDYAKRDSRSRQMLELIEAADKREDKVPRVQDLDDFKLK